MNIARDEIEADLRLHVDRLAGLIGVRNLKRPKTLQATTLLVEQPGAKRASEIVLLGAHDDTLFSASGRDDNASAVAVMLERRSSSRVQRAPNDSICCVW